MGVSIIAAEGTRTESTVTAYLKRAGSLYRAAKNSLPDQGILTHKMVVHWVRNRLASGDISKVTWRQFKAALICYLERQEGDGEAQEALEELKGMYNDGKRGRPSLKTSSNKLKSLDAVTEYRFLEEWLPSRGTQVALSLRDWIISSLNVGARPSEWEFAELSADGTELRLKNGKSTNGRAHGTHRTINLEHLDKDVRQTIRNHVDRIHRLIEQGEDFRSFHKSMENAIFRESRLCFPRRKRHISLYTMRHQFSADMKASGKTKPEVGALMGHANDRTAGQHYARAGVGYAKDGVKVNQEELARVRVTDNKWEKDHVASNG